MRLPPTDMNPDVPTHAFDPWRFSIACSASALVLEREGQDSAAQQLRELAHDGATATEAGS